MSRMSCKHYIPAHVDLSQYIYSMAIEERFYNAIRTCAMHALPWPKINQRCSVLRTVVRIVRHSELVWFAHRVLITCLFDFIACERDFVGLWKYIAMKTSKTLIFIPALCEPVIFPSVRLCPEE